MSDQHTNLAEQALDNLVNQFARPLDFLRELVQNSIDAGSPRIEVRIDYERPAADETVGVTAIHVDDWGEGMDEAIIDGQLTRLFSSAKEGDLTKIGKFGIGFTSIFAIRPEIVQLRTGRHGENWELLFQQDRSYLKNRIDDPIDGTKITLFKRMGVEEVEKFVEEARFILTYWCEHSNVPVTFWDRTRGDIVEAVDEDDPFAAFESATETVVGGGPEAVNRPLDAVDADLSVQLHAGETEAVVGIGRQPLYGYYNGGLTLLRTRNLDALQKFEPQVKHLVFKLKNDALEHTLTRDNVLQDAAWEDAMKVVLDGRTQLVDKLVDALADALKSGEDPRHWQAHLARLAEEPDVLGMVRGRAESPMFLSALGAPLSLAEVEAQRNTLDVVLTWDGDPTLAEGILAAGHHVVADSPEARALLSITHDPGLFSRRTSAPIARADDVFVLPEFVDPATLDDQERKLLAHTSELLTKAVGSRLRSIRLGDFGGPELGATEALCLDGASEDGVFMRRRETRFGWLIEWLPSILRLRHMLVNRHHPLYRAQLLASIENPWLAAAGLASALLHVEDIEPERIHRLLLNLAHRRLELT